LKKVVWRRISNVMRIKSNVKTTYFTIRKKRFFFLGGFFLAAVSSVALLSALVAFSILSFSLGI
jgi:hypothetical protein